MHNAKRSSWLAALFLFSVGIAFAQAGQRAPIAGKFLSEKHPQWYMVLKSDGTFYLVRDGKQYKGTYTVSDKNVTFSFYMLSSTSAEMKDDSLVFEGQEKWTRK
jgi:hypothetical protein